MVLPQELCHKEEEEEEEEEEDKRLEEGKVVVSVLARPGAFTCMAVHAEISVIPITGRTSMGKEVALAFDAIKKTKGVRATLTALGTQMEAEDISAALAAVKAAHAAVKKAGAARVISSVRIDERLDKDQSLEAKVRSVKKRLA
ncbi:MAG TPA: MTH1187 family thiamine-binding protein [Nitrososphaera sp.]|nr:MTH1187 family thiamine-binding protein [Nitrososphaera sp.]